jgi:hypothetical protein
MFNILSIKDMQIKTTLRYTLSWSEWPSRRKQTTNAREDAEVGKEPSYILGGNAN